MPLRLNRYNFHIEITAYETMLSVKYVLTALGLFSMYKSYLVNCGDREKLANKYTQIIRTETGYGHHDLELKRDELNLDRLNVLKTKLINRLQCSYIYSGLHYLRVSTLLLEHGHAIVSGNVENASEFSFSEETVSMLTTLLNSGQVMNMTTMWGMFMYTKFFEMVAEGGMEYNQHFVAMHCSVFEKYIMGWQEKFGCDENNEFNDDSPSTQFYKDLQQAKTYTEYPRVFSVVLKNLKTKVSMQLEFNEKLISTKLNRHSFSTDGLSFNNVLYKRDVMQNLMLDFGGLIEWESILASMVESYEARNRSIHVSTRFAGLTEFQKEFICLLKIAMLRIISRHLHYVNELLLPKESRCFGKQLTIPLMLIRVNKKMSIELTEFMRFASLTHDVHFKELTQLFNKPFVNFNNSNNNDQVIAKLNMLISGLLVELYNCDPPFEKSFYADDMTGSISWLKTLANAHQELAIGVDFKSENPPIVESLASARIFNNYLRFFFVNIRFEVIHSFIQFTNDLKQNYSFLDHEFE